MNMGTKIAVTLCVALLLALGACGKKGDLEAPGQTERQSDDKKTR